MPQQLIARKAMTYAGRALQAGDTFTASNRDGRLLVAIKKASLHVPTKAAVKESGRGAKGAGKRAAPEPVLVERDQSPAAESVDATAAPESESPAPKAASQDAAE